MLALRLKFCPLGLPLYVQNWFMLRYKGVQFVRSNCFARLWLLCQ